MDVDGNVTKLESTIKRRRYTIEALESVKEEINKQLDMERSLLMDNRTELVGTQVCGDDVAKQLFDLEPESPMDLFRSVSELLGGDLPVSVVRELFIRYDFDESDLLELRRSDDVEIIDISPDDTSKVETLHMHDT
jgi:hypothetical protein